MLPYFAIVAPAMLVPTLLGAKLHVGISEARFRQIVLGLLTASGLALLSSSLPILLSCGAAGRGLRRAAACGSVGRR